jgi:hypothetical protein
MAAIDLQQFCSDDPFRENLSKPFTLGDFTYATNGHILVRLPKIDGVEEIKNAPNPSKIFKDFPAPNYFVSLPALALPPLEGPEIVDCDVCGGSGKEHECPDCDCECMACDGSGKEHREKKISTTLAGVILQLRYVRKLAALPHVEIAPHLAIADKSPVFFRFDGGDGALMPMISEFETHVQIERKAA